MSWHVLIIASALLLMLRHFYYVSRHVLISASVRPAYATTLRLRDQPRSDQGFDISDSATTLQLHDQACSDQCFGTPAYATTLLLREQTRSDQGFGISDSATPLLLGEQARSD